MIWFTSDTHFGHANVLHFTDRPFGDIAHMNRALINAINERVAPADDLYILGDFSYQMTAVEAEASRRCASALRELGLGRWHHAEHRPSPQPSLRMHGTSTSN